MSSADGVILWGEKRGNTLDEGGLMIKVLFIYIAPFELLKAKEITNQQSIINWNEDNSNSYKYLYM